MSLSTDRQRAGRRSFRRSVQAIAVAMLALIAPRHAMATTWVVEADPEHPEGRIESAVQQAASGDTVAVGPGLYYEHIPIPLIDLTIIGRDGAGPTILDGQRSATDREGSILYRLVIGFTGTLRLEGLTFQHGSLGSSYEGLSRTRGGAIAYGGGPGLVLKDCLFLENGIGSTDLDGGALWLGGVDKVTIDGCLFRDNAADWGGGSLTSQSCGVIDVQSSAFEVNGTGGLGASFIWAQLGTDVRLQENSFVNRGIDGGAGSMLDCVNVYMLSNRFEDHGSCGATIMTISSLTAGDLDPATCEIMGNVFWRDRTAVSALGFFAGAYGYWDISNNTFVRVPVSAGPLPISYLFSHNITTDAPCHLYSDFGEVSCNVSWPDPMSIDVPTVRDNQVANPLFCNDDAGDVQIALNSPCAAEYSPAGCGLIGALGVNCGSTPVLETSWGRIKYLLGGKTLHPGGNQNKVQGAR